ncbi:DUF481 domain-containing protein [Acidisarcina polymorpha]|nr:DUF481 domain-containing protein [Acidisarcina polymorpha]
MTCRADVIRFGEQEAVTGQVVSVNRGSITFRSDHLGLLHFNVTPDLTISIDGLITIESTDGRKLVGLMRPDSGPRWTLLVNGGVQEASITPEQIVSLRLTPAASFSSKEVAPTETRENSWEGATNKPSVTGAWNLESAFSFTGVQATKDRRLLNWTGKLEEVTNKGHLTFSGDRIYSTSSNPKTGKHNTDDDETHGEAQYTKSIGPRTSAYLDFRGTSDQTNLIDHAFTASGGLRYKLVRSDSIKVTLFGGPSWLDYAFLPNDGVPTQGLQFGAAQIGYNAELDLPANTVIKQDFTFNQGVDSGHSFEATALFTVRHMLNSWLYVDARVFDDYDSRTAYQAEHSRLRYSGGVGVKLSAF